MKKGRKIIYSITSYESYYYIYKLKCWKHLDDVETVTTDYGKVVCKYSMSNYQHAKTMSAAIRKANKLISSGCNEAIIIRFFYKKGIRYSQEFVLKNNFN